MAVEYHDEEQVEAEQNDDFSDQVTVKRHPG